MVLLAPALTIHVATMMVFAQTGGGTPSRPAGPCDIYTADGLPCVAAHSSTRALYASYNGPLYQVLRQSDGGTLDIGVVQPSRDDPGGYADATAQDKFCANTYCWITALYDQSGMGNHLVQAPRGGFSGPAMGGFNNIPIADMAPVTVMGHKVYGIFIEPGMGLRQDDPKGTAVDDQAEGQYWVVNGHHYNSGCCFDYGNAETDSRDDGDGTMETTYYGNATSWYHGQAPGPWIMTDQENNLVGCVNPSPNDKYCADLPIITWRFVIATADGEPHHWRSMGGDARQGGLQVMFDGTRVINDRSSYDPMRKQGAILLGNGGDNSNGSQGTFYEGAMTAPGTFPTVETNQKIQANIMAARYDVARVSIAPASAIDTPPGLQTFFPGSSQNTTVTFTNTTGAPVTDVELSINVPRGWTSVALGSTDTSKTFVGRVAPGATVNATFTVSSGPASFNGDLVGSASWRNSATHRTQSGIVIEKVRNVSPVKINEFAVSSGFPANSTNAFIELYNAGNSAVDISEWTLTPHATQLPVFSSVKIPIGTKLAAKGFYLLGLSNSGLAVPAKKGDTTVYVRNTTGISVGDTIEIGTSSAIETCRVAAVTTPQEPEADASPFGGFGRFRRGAPRGTTTVWQPLPEGPVITIPSGSKNIPVASIAGFEVGQKVALGYGATYPTTAQTIEKYEVVEITKVGKPGMQAWLSMDAKVGDTNIKVSSVENISVGDTIRLDIDSEGHGIETVKVTRVGTASSRSTFNGPLIDEDDPGTGLDLAEPLRFDHSSNMPFSVRGTGIGFQPASAFDHSSNEPVLALSSSIVLDQPLSRDHAIDAVVRDEKVTTAGYRGARVPDQWFGGPALSSSAGNMVLRDADGRIVDSLNYGELVDPWAAEGYQAASGTDARGCFVPAPRAVNAGFAFFGGQGGSAPGLPNMSAGRFPDGVDNDSNCNNFQLQTTASLAAAATVGAKNIKVTSVADFALGQTISIDSGENLETATIAAVGTPGGATMGTATEAGATEIPVTSIAGFTVGQTITVDTGANQETAIVAAITRGRFGFGGFAGGRSASITVTEPLVYTHAEGAQVSASGITLAGALKKPHDNGAPLAGSIPTPGEPNRY
jgi:hypothetical protein